MTTEGTLWIQKAWVFVIFIMLYSLKRKNTSFFCSGAGVLDKTIQQPGVIQIVPEKEGEGESER